MSQTACTMIMPPEKPKTPSPETPITCGISCVEAMPSQDGKPLQSQKHATIQPRQPLMETPTKRFTDSGYSSLSTTPSEKPLEIDRAKGLPRSPIPFLFSKKKKVFFHDKPTDQSTRDRFRAIQPSFEKLLLEEVRSHQKPGTRHKPISIRLAMMGTSENDARPHIAIFCQLEQKKLVQAFVKKDIVVDIYRPKDLSAPAFEVIVFGNAPKLRFSKSNIEIVTDAEYLPATPQDTLCGIPISSQDPTGQRRNATFGGIIKVVTANGSTELFGMTAGHVLHQWNRDSDEDMLDSRSPQNTHKDPDGSFIIDTDETDEDECSEYELDFVPFSAFPGALVEDGSRLWDFESLTILGELIDISEEHTIRAGQCYDWALFQPILYNMNLVPTNPRSRLRICEKRPGAIANRAVIVLSGPMGYKAGTILREPGRILLGEEFIDAFMVIMSEGPGIRDGDSGSWVVDATHFEVYGQLVASDMFGSGYVIPMTDIFGDIKSKLEAQSVELPSFIDIMQARAIGEGRRLSTCVEGHCGSQTMSASINSKSSTLTVDHHVRFPISDSSDISDASLDSGYSSLNPSPNLEDYLSSTRSQLPSSGETGKERLPATATSNVKEEKRKNLRKRRFSRSQLLERVAKKQAM